MKRVFTQHVTLWALLYAVIACLQMRQLNYIGFNLIEPLIGKNLLHGWGYVFAPLDPPALSRPFLASFEAGIIGLFVDHPTDVFRVFYVASMTSFLCSVFYLFKSIAGVRAAHVSAAFLLLTPLFVTFPWALAGHYASHLGLLSVMGWALWATVKAWQTPRWQWYAGAGFLWALTFLARYEMVLPFLACWGVTLLYRLVQDQKVAALKSAAVFFLAFAPIFVIKDIYYHDAAKRYGIVADNAIYTFYTGEVHSRAGGVTANGDNLGWELSQKIYGTVEENHGSLLYLMWRFPGLIWERFVRNFHVGMREIFLSRYYFMNGAVLGGAFILSWSLVFLPFLFLERARPYRWYALLFLTLHLAGFVNFMFHIDLRYLTPMAYFLFFLDALGLAVLVNAVAESRGWTGKIVGALAALWALNFSFRHLDYLPDGPIGGRMDGEGYAEIGKFLKSQKLATPPVVWADLPTDLFLLQPFFSYFADTAIEWHFTGPYPLDKMAALATKNREYIVVNDQSRKSHPELANDKVLFEVKTPDFGMLYLFRAFKN